MDSREQVRQIVLAAVPTAVCTRSPSSGGWKVYNSNGWIALSGSWPTADEAWAEAASRIEQRTGVTVDG